MDEVGAQDCESCSQIPAAVLFHALERIEVEHPTLWMLSFGVDTTHQDPAAQVAGDCQVVPVKQEEGSCVVFHQRARP